MISHILEPSIADPLFPFWPQSDEILLYYPKTTTLNIPRLDDD